jgi:hypothetical protein
MHEPISVHEKVKIQAFAGSSDLPKMTTDVFNVTMETPNWDLFWQEAFQGVPLLKGQLEWEIATVDTGITFKAIPEGGKIEYADEKGEKIKAEVVKYGAGLALTWEIIEGRKLQRFVEIMKDARAKLYNLWANIHYGLLATAAALTGVAWQGIATDTVLSRDIRTLTAGYNTIGTATKDKGYGDTANARMIMYTSPNLRQRLNQAMRVTSVDAVKSGGVGVGTGQVVDSNIDIRYTYNGNITVNTGVMCLPGHKIQNAVYLQELGLTRQEIESLNELRAYWTAFGATIADTDQCAELTFV